MLICNFLMFFSVRFVSFYQSDCIVKNGAFEVIKSEI